jgi:hypothetical protein
MSFKSKILIAIIGIVWFDATASVLSKLLQFDYSYLIPVSLLIYVVVGYWGAYRRGFIFGILLGGLAGLGDATLGWFVSTQIGAFTRSPMPAMSPLVLSIVIIVVTTSGLIFGLIGAALCAAFGKARPQDKRGLPRPLDNMFHNSAAPVKPPGVE